MRIRQACTLLALLALLGTEASAQIQVTNGTDVGIGTLRWAIEQANLTLAKETITFAVPPVGTAVTIQPTGALPTIVSPVVIDGWSQLSATGCEAGVELDGSLAGPTPAALHFQTTNSDVKGMCINQWLGNGIWFQGGGNHRVFGCFIGTDITGSTGLGNAGNGILMTASFLNDIGLLPTTSCTNRNIISDNGLSGIKMAAGADNNTLQNNHVGVDFNGSVSMGNGWHGVEITGASIQNEVGTTAGPKPVNVISGNATNGVHIGEVSTGNEVFGNHIGVNRLGWAALPNAVDGVHIRDSGGNFVGDSSGEARNVIAGNGDDGVEIQGTNSSAVAGCFVQGNYIGVGTNGYGQIPNGDDGVLLYSNCTQNIIGGTVVGARNLISGNYGCGVKIEHGPYGNWVYGNYIGVNRDGLGAVSNAEFGVLIVDRANGNWIGNPTTEDTGNLISGNGANVNWGGVGLYNGADENTVCRNRIGLGADGAVLPNMGDGIRIVNAGSNSIGGSLGTSRNFISGNNGDGIQIGTNAHFNTVLNNYIGVDTNGVRARPNAGEGVFIFQSTFNTIGTNMAGNVLSGNQGSGVKISDSAQCRENTVGGNRIGTDVAGTSRLGNSDNGVTIYGSPSNRIGGAFQRNTISGNDKSGIQIEGAGAEGNKVFDNAIGVDDFGASVVSNGTDGVSVFDAARTIIGGAGVLGNDISGNGRYGVLLNGLGAFGNRVQGNRVGVNGVGAAMPNGHSGVVCHNAANNNLIGSTNSSEGNVIAYNSEYGVLLLTTSATNNAVLGNSIHDNRNLGIEIGLDGVTANDSLDADDGANGLQNYPVIHSATTGSVYMGGTLGSKPLTTYRVECFLNTNNTIYGVGEGQVYLGYTNLTTAADGSVSNCFIISFSYAAKTGQYVTATATDPFGNTSEFSPWVEILPNDVYDADGDGMPGAWETDHGLDPNDRTGDEGATGDPDTDDVGNYEEYVADTDPHNESNYLHIVVFQHPSNSVVTFTSTNTRYYLVQVATNVQPEGYWTNLYTTAIPGANGTTTTNEPGEWTNRFYRVKVQLTP